jgi:hypothetical protein
MVQKFRVQSVVLFVAYGLIKWPKCIGQAIKCIYISEYGIVKDMK